MTILTFRGSSDLPNALTLFYMGFWRYVNTWGGSKQSPPIEIHQKDSNLVKRHVLAKIDYCYPLFMHLDLNHYHFWPQNGPKNRCIFRHIEGSPLWIVCGKNCRREIFWKFQKKIPKMAHPGPFYYWKEQSHEKSAHLGYPRGLAYNN